MKRLPIRLVEISQWPVTTAISSMMMTTGMINWFHFKSTNILIMSAMVMMMSTYQWWRDMTREATYM